MSTKIITDSSCDLPDELLQNFKIEMVPLRVSFENGATYLDRLELSPVLFASKMRSCKTLPKTSTPDPAMMIAAFEKGLAEAENVVFICLSSALSSTHQTAHLACKTIGSDRIRIFDTKSVSLGTGILAIAAAIQAHYKPKEDIIICRRWGAPDLLRLLEPMVRESQTVLIFVINNVIILSVKLFKTVF